MGSLSAAKCTSCPWVTHFIRHTSVILTPTSPIKSRNYRLDKTLRSRAHSGEGSVKVAQENHNRHASQFNCSCISGLLREPVPICHTLQFRNQHCQEKNRKARIFEDNVVHNSDRENASIAFLKTPSGSVTAVAAKVREHTRPFQLLLRPRISPLRHLSSRMNRSGSRMQNWPTHQHDRRHSIPDRLCCRTRRTCNCSSCSSIGSRSSGSCHIHRRLALRHR